MPHAIIRGANGRRHEVDFGDAPVRVEIYASEETVEIFIEADSEMLPEERRRFALLNIPRHLFSQATAATARRAAKSHPSSSIAEKSRHQLIPGLVRSPISFPRTLCSVSRNSPMVAIQNQIRVVHHGCSRYRGALRFAFGVFRDDPARIGCLSRKSFEGSGKSPHRQSLGHGVAARSRRYPTYRHHCARPVRL
jgi:hypothetical protein